MNKFLLSALILSSFSGFSQITINSGDLPLPGQEYLRSNASNSDIIDVDETGANHLWDYSLLERDSRDTLDYQTVSSTPFVYQFKFNSPLSPDYQATEAKYTPDVNLGGFLDMTNNFLFSKNTSTEWNEVGIGTTVSSIPLPTKYSDIKTKLLLPLNFNDANTDSYSYLMNIPAIGALGQDGTLTYTVDGWGKLKTPEGEYDVLRVKTELIKSDTIFLNQLNFGLRIPSNETIYEWYAVGEGFPVLTVTVGQLGQVTSALFKDDLTVSVKNIGANSVNSVYPNPTQNVLNLNLDSETYQVSVLNISGKTVLSSNALSPSQLDVSYLPKGVYFIKLKNNSSVSILRFVKN